MLLTPDAPLFPGAVAARASTSSHWVGPEERGNCNPARTAQGNPHSEFFRAFRNLLRSGADLRLQACCCLSSALGNERTMHAGWEGQPSRPLIWRPSRDDQGRSQHFVSLRVRRISVHKHGTARTFTLGRASRGIVKLESCAACDSELEHRRERSTQGAFCQNCGWSVVTTYVPPIQLDETRYEVRVANGDPATTSTSKPSRVYRASMSWLHGICSSRLTRGYSRVKREGWARFAALCRKPD